MEYKHQIGPHIEYGNIIWYPRYVACMDRHPIYLGACEHDLAKQDKATNKLSNIKILPSTP